MSSGEWCRSETATRHRASYTLELGRWFATCRECGHRVDDKDRRRAASQFRQHIQAMAKALGALPTTIDLRGSVNSDVDALKI